MRRLLDDAPLIVYGDGSQTRDYVFVEDLCDGIVAAMAAGASGTFQLGSGSGTTLTALIEQIAAVAGRPAVRACATSRSGRARSATRGPT